MSMRIFILIIIIQNKIAHQEFDKLSFKAHFYRVHPNQNQYEIWSVPIN